MEDEWKEDETDCVSDTMAEGLGDMIVDDDLPDKHDDAKDDDEDIENDRCRIFTSKSRGSGIEDTDNDGKEEGEPEEFCLGASLDQDIAAVDRNKTLPSFFTHLDEHLPRSDDGDEIDDKEDCEIDTDDGNRLIC